ncbi:regulator of G-protein signaling 9 [Melanerpes formicivorus]|uniref:regulator of G-protein signaling 9 n=1 Tax=Melanerpes formicivorus TaxID=211600 RepID=UPI00358E20FF
MSHWFVIPLGLIKPLSFSSPQPCLPASQAPCPAVHAGTAPLSLPHSTACPSPISVALDTTVGTEQEPEGTSPGPLPSSSRRSPVATLSFARFLKRGCWTSPVLGTLSPKCPAVSHGKVQPLGEQQQLQPHTKVVSSFFQIKTDAPLESKTCPVGSEEGEHNHRRALKVICPWETPMEEGKAG